MTSCAWNVNKGRTRLLSNFVKSDWNWLLVPEKSIKEEKDHNLIWLLLKSTSCTLKVNKGSTGSLFYWTVTEIYFLYMKSQQRKYRVTILLCKMQHFRNKMLRRILKMLHYKNWTNPVLLEMKASDWLRGWSHDQIQSFDWLKFQL